MATSKEIYNDIVNTIANSGSTKKATFAWIAGAFKKTHDFGRMQSRINNYADELSPDTLESLKNMMILKDIGVSNGLFKVENGKYKVTNKGSKFVQDVAKNISKWESLNDMTFKELRSEIQQAKGEADMEWYNGLPPDEQYMIDLYSKLTLKEFHYLTGIKNDKDRKQKYVNRVETLEDSDFESYSLLRELGFITPKNTINDTLLTKFFTTLGKYDYRHLRSFNRSISSRSDRIAADKALHRNNSDYQTDDMADNKMTANVRMPMDVEEPNNRQQQRSRILGGRKQSFNDRMHRTRVANESKKLSFKNYLMETLDK